jgi:putative glycosyltransferase
MEKLGTKASSRNLIRREQIVKKEVSVIVPSYNRGYILEKTIPSYIQDEVAELILVDDASADDTPEVVNRLQQKYPIIRYIRLGKNMKQTAAKNRGIMAAGYPYIYFGDDDSFILPGTIGYLLETLHKENADVVGALALYANNETDMAEIETFVSENAPYVQFAEEIVNLRHLERVAFKYRVSEPLRLPFVHACALAKTTFAKSILFDVSYQGNAYREETDFFLRCAEAGAVIYYDSRGVQINYPFSMINRIRTLKSMWRHGYYDILNSLKLIYRHHWFLKKEYQYPYSRAVMMCLYILNSGLLYLGILPGRLYGIIRRKWQGAVI